MKGMLKVVLDTNILLSSISRKSPYSYILTALFENKYELCVSTEILLEYEEKIITFFDAQVAETLISALLMRSNVKKIEPYFDLYLIKNDIDDNKFVNCAFAGNVHYLVSNDKHFNVLKTTPFPKIPLLSITEFFELLSE
jgi:putative PIN family toxin of toxin-antitoxin system